MLEEKPVTKHFPDLDLVRKVNKTQFPLSERMPVWMLLRMARRKNGITDFLAYYDDDLFVGFTILYTIEDLTSVVILAVDGATQSKGYGSRILAHIKSIFPDNRITINIEVLDESANNSEQRIRRRNFYFKNGYESSGYVMKLIGPEYEALISNGHSIQIDEVFSLYKAMFGTFLFLLLKPLARIRRIDTL